MAWEKRKRLVIIRYQQEVRTLSVKFKFSNFWFLTYLDVTAIIFGFY